jgi:hypothetical protein
MNNINITIELSKDDRQLLEGLMGSITLLSSVLGNAQPKEVQQKVIEEVTAPQVAETRPAADEIPADHPLIEASALVEEPKVEDPTPVAETTPEVKPVSLAEFQKAVTLAISQGAEAKQAAKDIINKYAASVSAVPEDKRAEVMAELAKI